MTEEHRIQNEIRAALSPYCIIFRMNVGSGRTEDGRFFSTGVPRGFSDLFGVRISDEVLGNFNTVNDIRKKIVEKS